MSGKDNPYSIGYAKAKHGYAHKGKNGQWLVLDMDAQTGATIARPATPEEVKGIQDAMRGAKMKRKAAPPNYVWDEFPAWEVYDPDASRPWVEITPRLWDYCLGVLPPAKWQENAFAVGEAVTHIDEKGWAIPVYDMVVNIGDMYKGGRAFLSPRPVTTFDPQTYTAEINKQFGILRNSDARGDSLLPATVTATLSQNEHQEPKP